MYCSFLCYLILNNHLRIQGERYLLFWPHKHLESERNSANTSLRIHKYKALNLYVLKSIAVFCSMKNISFSVLLSLGRDGIEKTLL